MIVDVNPDNKHECSTNAFYAIDTLYIVIIIATIITAFWLLLLMQFHNKKKQYILTVFFLAGTLASFIIKFDLTLNVSTNF